MTNQALSVSGLTVSFGAKRAVKGATFSVRRGEITGFLGPNGAGKTTVMGAIMGLVKQDAGTIELLGQRDGSRLAATRLRVGFLQEKPRVYPEMSARAYLRFFADLYGVPDAGKRVEETLERVGLTSAAMRPLGTFSRGMQQRACLARVMLHRPEFLMLDEPTLGLDPRGVADMRTVFREMKAQGVTLLFSSHQLAEMERVCDSVVFMRGGEVIASGSPQDIVPQRLGRNVFEAELFEPASIALSAIQASERFAELRAVGENRLKFALVGVPADRRAARADAARALTAFGLTVLSLTDEAPSLEDVFISLTREDAPRHPPLDTI
ncbi:MULTISPECIES: ABC transporter ATP-binding protein [unclassified Rhizobium]|uniref:ABC transporter ATP-binding protein n=1 Tax=unclassified Rhizobium TaxID=2613769 RepID=UPI0003F96C22|nr:MULTISPECIES: ABC transporter ATP-binding protein [unclassified Rhizobium]MBD9454971.1 ABC transporter ATP-binding protein [Rhizobium sp. RHZ02]NMN71538.1 ABC-2 type transport system ATP-binding protein [Rhizobium sp. 57MFTsu3.2]